MYFCIQYSNNPDSERLDELLALQVIFQRTQLKVTFPIQLDAQLELNRKEIDDE